MKKNIITLLTLALSVGAFAQGKIVEGPGVGIGTRKVTPSAMLEVAAKDKGVLIPRVELTKLTDFGMNGGDAAKAVSNGLIVYNTKVNATENLVEGFYYWSVDKWNLVVNDKTFRDEIKRIETKIGGGNTDGGGTVIYIPGKDGEPGKPGTPGEIKYVDEKGGTHTIEIKELIQGSETNTFFRMQTLKVNDPVDATKPQIDVTRLLYFDEEVVSEFLKECKVKGIKNPDVNTIPDAKGKIIDINGMVAQNFKEIINNVGTKETIEKIISEMTGNVTIVNTGDTVNPKWEIHVGDGKGGSTVFDINNLETKTSITKSSKAGLDVAVDAKPSDPTDGEVYYTYLGETKDANGKQKGFYINVTEDVRNIITNNPLVKQDIFNVVNNYGETGTGPKASSIVMYGSPVAGTKIDGVDYVKDTHGDVLFRRDISADGKTITDTHINITNEIIRELTKETNNQFKETIREVTRIEVLPGTGTDGNSGGDVFTNEVIDGFMVYKGSAVVKVNDAFGYDSTFNGNITVKPMKLGADKKTLEEDATVNIKKLKSVVVINKTTGVFGVNTATDVTITGKELKFHFGAGSMYTTLNNGDYEVIFEYISDKKVK